MAETAAAQLHYDTLPPDAVSAELQPVIDELGLAENCRQLAMEGWTVVENVADDDFNARLRQRIVDISGGRPGGADGTTGANMLLVKDAVFAEAILKPKLMAMAEFSVGAGFLISQIAASVRPEGAAPIGLHADSNWLPAPFPAHNMLLTGCWACDEYTKAGGSTLIVPGSANLRRHPDADEVKAIAQESAAGSNRPGRAIAIECPPGSVAMWDGNVWHSNWPRTDAGERVVCHITYTRLMMRPVEDYSSHADELIEQHGPRMAQMLGREDFLNSPSGADYSKLITTFNNAKR